MKVRAKRFVKLRVDLFDRHLLLDHASAIAFNVLKALVPLTLLALAVLGAVGQRNVWSKTLFARLQQHLQPQTAHAIDAGAQRIFSTDSTGLIVFAALLVIWYVSGAVRAVIGSINDIYETDETRPWKVRYPVSFGLAFTIAVCLVGSLLVVTVGSALAHNGFAGLVVSIGRWLVAIGLLALAVAVLVRYAPADRRAKKWASAG